MMSSNEPGLSAYACLSVSSYVPKILAVGVSVCVPG